MFGREFGEERERIYLENALKSDPSASGDHWPAPIDTLCALSWLPPSAALTFSSSDFDREFKGLPKL